VKIAESSPETGEDSGTQLEAIDGGLLAVVGSRLPESETLKKWAVVGERRFKWERKPVCGQCSAAPRP
jgi:hypothetical protein